MADEDKRSPLKGALAGSLAGIVASAVMDGYWWVTRNVPGARPEQKPRPSDRNQQDKEPATQIVADKVSEAVTGHEVPKDQKAAAGVLVHYAFGTFWAGVYGALAGGRPSWGTLAGLVYGVGVWLFGDEIGLRVLRVAPAMDKVSLKQHLQALGAHLVWGSVLGVATRFLLKRGT